MYCSTFSVALFEGGGDAGKREAPSTLPPGSRPIYPLYRWLGRPRGRFRQVKIRRHWDSIPGRLTRSELLCRLSYPEPHKFVYIFVL